MYGQLLINPVSGSIIRVVGSSDINTEYGEVYIEFIVPKTEPVWVAASFLMSYTQLPKDHPAQILYGVVR